jgi:predicted N-formylglutamate amidohydrolase
VKLVITCEHGGNEIPVKYASYFKEHEAILKTHRGIDLGALEFFNHLKILADFTSFSKTSRLFIELNRSLHHKNLFSECTKDLPLSTKEEIVANYYLLYRNSIEDKIAKHINQNELIIHLSIHSFTPVLHAVKRNCDIGILFDSRIPLEKKVSVFLKESMVAKTNNFKVRYNYPYLGKMDGFTTYLRKKFPKNYVGIEIEINQKYVEDNREKMILKKVLFDAVSALKTNNS